MSDDDVRHAVDACERKLAAAEEVEPAITLLVREAVEAFTIPWRTGEADLKSPKSLFRKIQAYIAQFGDHAEDAAYRVRDALRYTVVLSDDNYWERADDIVTELESLGIKRVKASQGWRRNGYRGRNESFVSRTEQFEFEIQFHTEASLDAREQTHRLYEDARDPRTSIADRNTLLEALESAYDLVPVPTSVQWVD
ncbi:hypothetical protein [Mycobacterium antarcticum]|uniref:hypothetical protein n=1 Tax=Mycolicibacterium sp. TUM20984 TaxID=3023368 RepID=UPI0024E115CD|nr:hypothetical protein [Mycolicibacterium sp. TUM20984]